MSPVSRILIATVVAATPLVASPAPVSACGGVECTVRCVQDLVTQGFCRLG